MSAGFEAALAAVRDVRGWLSDDQARRLYECAGRVPPGGRIVEIGSYRGRSAIVLAKAAAAGVTITAIDPHTGDDRGPRQWYGTSPEGEADLAALQQNLERAGVSDLVQHVRLASSDALQRVSGAIELVYVDGAHSYRPARADIAGWGARVTPGGTLLIHDSFSAVGVTLAILRELALGSHFLYAGRSRSLTEYRRVEVSLRPLERLRNCARQLAQLPWFARNLLVKLLIVAKLRREEWPY